MLLQVAAGSVHHGRPEHFHWRSDCGACSALTATISALLPHPPVVAPMAPPRHHQRSLPPQCAVAQVVHKPTQQALAGMLGLAIGVMATVSVVELIVRNAMQHDALLVLVRLVYGPRVV